MIPFTLHSPLQIEARAPDITCTNLADWKRGKAFMDGRLEETGDRYMIIFTDGIGA